MAAHFRPYKEGDKWIIDADADDELNYVANVRQWCVDNATTVASFDIIPVGVDVMLKGTAQGEFSSMLPAKFQVNFSVANAHATFRSTTADGQQFDKTIWFKQVEN